MPTLEEMINQIDVSSRAAPEEPGRRTIWQQIKGEWPPLIPPPPPLTLENVWQYVLLDDPTPPSAEQLAAQAAKEDRDHPECHNAMYRRSHPDWLEEKVGSYAEYHGEQRWKEIERYLNGGSGLSQERSEWLCRHEELIRPLVEEAKAGHVARYGGGRLKRVLASIAEHRRS
jgi:hypothetical protein